MEKVVFVDRDGVINVEKDYLYKIEDFEFIEGTFEALRHLQNLGYKIVVITNQSGIGRGYYTIEDFEVLTDWMLERFKDENINISGVFFCPHGPDDGCTCRKPKTGMIDQAKKLFQIDFKNSWLIGDKDSDIKTAHNAGIPNTVQVMTGHSFDEKGSKASFILDSIKDIPQIVKS